VLGQPVVHGVKRIAMQAGGLLTGDFGFGQPVPVSSIVLQANLTELVEQFCFTLGVKQYLVVPEISQWASGSAPADAPLTATKFSEQRLHLQVVRR
jgi:hypothetical protein